MKNILIPTDFSDLAEHAYNIAKNLFQGEEVNIHVLTVVPVTPDVLFDEKGELLDDGILDFKQLHEKRAAMEQAMEDWIKGKQKITRTKVKIGRVADDVIQYGKSNEIDLIVMGTSGATGLKEIFMGSHAAYIAMRSPIPVLSVKAESKVDDLKKIVLVGDFRNPQIVDLALIKNNVDDPTTKVQLLKINTPGDFETNEEVVSRMKEFAELNELGTVEYHVYCDHSIEKGIASFSEEHDCDLIAIGSQQRTGLSRIVRKSISYDAINHLKQAIISFPVR